MAVLPSTSGFPGCGHFFDIRDIPKIDEDVFRLVSEDVVVIGRKCPFQNSKRSILSLPPSPIMDGCQTPWMPNTVFSPFEILAKKKKLVAEYATAALFSGDTWRVKYDETPPRNLWKCIFNLIGWSPGANDRPFRVAKGGGNSIIFGIFTPNLGKMIRFDEHIFQKGW